MQQEHPVLLFDGVCNLCNNAVQFLIKRDPEGNVKYASLQSEVAKELLSQFGYTDQKLSTIVLVDKGEMYLRSTAVLRVCRYLNGGWPAMRLFLLVPRSVRDIIYDWIARNRYRWFGKKDQCMLPSSDLKARFLEE